MKQPFHYIKLSGATFGIIFALILVAMPVFAGPAGAPPAGNVDASFSSVKAGGGATDVGGAFVGKNYGVLGQGRDVGGGRFESLTAPANVVELGLANLAMRAQGKIDIVGPITAGNSSVDVGGKFTGTQYGVFGSAAGTSGSAGYFESIYSGGKPYNSVLLGTPSSRAIFTNGSIEVKDGSIYVLDGKIKAAGGIGGIYTKEGVERTLVSTGYEAFYGECDSTSDRRLSCGIKSAGDNVVQADILPTNSACTIYAKNLDTVAQKVRSLITCFNPNGNW